MFLADILLPDNMIMIWMSSAYGNNLWSKQNWKWVHFLSKKCYFCTDDNQPLMYKSVITCNMCYIDNTTCHYSYKLGNKPLISILK